MCKHVLDRCPALRLLVFAAAVLTLIASTAQANTVVYNLTSLPNPTSVVFADYNNPSLTDTVSGTITVSSANSIFGTWNAGNLPPGISLSYDFSMSNSADALTHITGSEDVTTLINNGWIQGGGLTITHTGIFMPNPNLFGGGVLMQDLAGDISPYPLIVLNWNGNFMAFAKHNNLTSPDLQILATPFGSPTVDSLYGAGETWQIAAVVPEPSTWVQGLAAMASLGLVTLRKKFGRRS